MDALFDTLALMQHRQRVEGCFSSLLFKEVAERLTARLQDIRRCFSNILDLTPPHTGTMKPFLKPLYPAASFHQGLEAELSSLSSNTFDCIVSAVSLQWIQNLPAFLKTLRLLLRPDGLFLASFWGGDSLHELRTAFIQAEVALKGGASPRVIPMVSVLDAAALLQQAGFALPVVDQDTFTIYHPNLFSLSRHLRAMGESNALLGRAKTFTSKSLFQLAEAFYRQDYETPEKELPATFQLITLTGWAPDAHQQQALKPGSARYHLKDVLE